MEYDKDGTWIEWSRFVIAELRRLGDEARMAREHHEKTNDLLQEYNTQLKLHIAGVNTLDTKTDLLKKELEEFKKDTDKRLDIAELPISWAQTTGKIFGWIIALSGVVGAIYALVVFMRKG